MAGQLRAIARIDRDRQHQQRQNSNRMRRRKVMKWEEKACHAGENRSREKNPGPAVEPPRSKQPAQDNKARKNSNQTDDHVNDGENGQPQTHDYSLMNASRS